MLVGVSLAACSSVTPVTQAAAGGSDALTDGVVVGDLHLASDELPTYDPEAPLPSPGAAALRALMVLDPSVAELEGDVEAAERAAMSALLADLQAQLAVVSGNGVDSLASNYGAGKVAILAPNGPAPAGYSLSVGPDGINTAHDAGLIAGLISGLSNIWSPNVQAGAHTAGSVTETEGGATTTSTIELGRGTDGSTKLGMGAKTEASKNGVSVTAEFAGSVDGMRCPNADGQVSFTVTVRLGAESGGAGYTQDLTAFVRTVVDDDAKIVTTTVDIVQGTRQVKDGRQVYVESGLTVKVSGDDYANAEYSNLRTIRHSQDATQADATALSGAGHDAAFTMAMTALEFAKNNWLDGGCTKIEATSPGTVEPGSTTAIPVTVRHRFDGSVVPSKLNAELAGGDSVDPTSLAKTPGTLNYTAPNERGRSATIALTATSRRGRATLELTANTGEPTYRVNDSGALGRNWVSQCIPSLDRPFEIAWTSPQGTSEFQFIPDGSNSGTADVRVTNSQSGVTFTQEGQGTYTISVLGQDAQGRPAEWSIDIVGTGTVTQCVSGSCVTVENTSLDYSVPIVVNDSSCE
jgi:hypothetical protein